MPLFIEYTTVCIDLNGRLYDLRFEHPSVVSKDKMNVKDAFTMPVEEADKIRAKQK